MVRRVRGLGSLGNLREPGALLPLKDSMRLGLYLPTDSWGADAEAPEAFIRADADTGFQVQNCWVLRLWNRRLSSFPSPFSEKVLIPPELQTLLVWALRISCLSNQNTRERESIGGFDLRGCGS